jgi:hypothetical protein
MIDPKQSAWEEPSKLPKDWKASIKSLNQAGRRALISVNKSQVETQKKINAICEILTNENFKTPDKPINPIFKFFQNLLGDRISLNKISDVVQRTENLQLKKETSVPEKHQKAEILVPEKAKTLVSKKHEKAEILDRLSVTAKHEAIPEEELKPKQPLPEQTKTVETLQILPSEKKIPQESTTVEASRKPSDQLQVPVAMIGGDMPAFNQPEFEDFKNKFIEDIPIGLREAVKNRLTSTNPLEDFSTGGKTSVEVIMIVKEEYKNASEQSLSLHQLWVTANPLGKCIKS